MTSIRMLALDVDGTLAARGDEVTPATLDALHRASSAGVEVVIATGRRFRTALRVVDRLGLEVATVCLGGALVKESDRRTVHQTPIAGPAFSSVLVAMREEGLAVVAQRDSMAHGGADFVVDGGVRWTDPIARYVDDNGPHAESRIDLAERPPDDVLVAGTFGPHAELDRMARRLDDVQPGRFVTTLVPSPGSGPGIFYLEIVVADVSKWSALERLAALRGIPGDAVCAVGDQLNDMSMIDGAGLGVAMANGHDALKASADWVCGRHDEDGIVEVVDRILDDTGASDGAGRTASRT